MPSGVLQPTGLRPHMKLILPPVLTAKKTRNVFDELGAFCRVVAFGSMIWLMSSGESCRQAAIIGTAIRNDSTSRDTNRREVFIGNLSFSLLLQYGALSETDGCY